MENTAEIKRISALQRTALFGCLAEEELADIAHRAAELHFEKGEILFVSGDQAKGLFVVVNGQIRVFQQNAEGREQVMHVDTAGSVVAEVAVFDGGPYPASAMSDVDLDVLFIDTQDVHYFFKKYPALAMRALMLMAQRVRKACAIGGEPVLPGSRTETCSLLIDECAICGRADARSSCISPPFVPA